MSLEEETFLKCGRTRNQAETTLIKRRAYSRNSPLFDNLTQKSTLVAEDDDDDTFIKVSKL